MTRIALFVLIVLAFAPALSSPSVLADDPLPPRPDVAVNETGEDIALGPESLPAKGPPKLESSLWQLVEAQRRGGLGALSAEAERSGITLQDDAVRVIVEAQPGQASAVAQTATLQGGAVETSYGDLVQVLGPVASLEALSSSGGVRLVRQPTKYLPAITGEGVALVNADDWHAAGMTGSGVKVAVLDLGFAGYAGLLGTELPSSVTVQSFRADGDITGGGEVHGTAVAEIVHEVAPGAQLYLVNFQTDPELGNAVDWIVSQGIKVVNASWGCSVCGRGDGTGFDNDLVTDSIASGVQWAIASGNEAEDHWMGNWTSSDGDNWLEFSQSPFDETNTFAASAGSPMLILLKWDDVFGASNNDYDLCLLNSSLQVVFCSESVQDGNDDPVEGMVGTINTAGTYHIGIYRYSAVGSSHFHLYVDLPSSMQYVVAAGSLGIPADNASAITAGAVNWQTPGIIEPFSSQGPTEDGRTKPDLVGPDGVSGATYGPSAFYGTSAAAPHVAGAAALVKQAYPTYTPAQIKTFLEGRAVPLGAAGKDNIYGSGRLDLGSPPTWVDLTVTKTASPADGSSVSTGTPITYTLTTTNTASATGTATNVPIRDTIGTGLSLSSVTPGSGVTCSDTTPPEINCTATSIASGQSRTVTVVVTVTAVSGTVLNGAGVDPANVITETNEDADDPSLDCTAVGEGTDLAPATEPDNFDCTSHSVVAPDLTMTKTASPADGGSVNTGGTISYTLTVANSGSATASNVPIRDTIGTGLSLSSVTPGSGVTCSDTTPPEINCTAASITSGASRTVTVVVTVTAVSGAVVNGARVDPGSVITEANEDADDPSLDCTAVGEGTDAGDPTEPDNFDCTSHSVGSCGPGVDTDSDDFDNDVECYLGTDPLDACPDDPSDDAWPLDVNMDAQLSVVGDVLNFRGRIGATPGAPTWWQRLDFNADGQLSVVGDVLMYRGRIGETCT